MKRQLKTATRLFPIAILTILLSMVACGRGQPDDAYDPYPSYDYASNDEATPGTSEGQHEPQEEDNQPPADYVLFDEEELAMEVVHGEHWPGQITGTIIVNGQPIDADHRTIGDDIFPTHVPLEAVALALEVQVNWNQADGDVSMEGREGNIAFQVGSESFAVGGTLVTLPQPSALIDGVVYVPISFFREVFGMNNAMFYGGVVVIDDAEVMR